jgi:OmpA-OmpF porin, OOP family
MTTQILRSGCTLVLLASTLASAQSMPIPSFELERFTFNPGARETMTMGSGDLLDAKRLRLSLAGHYAHDPLVFTVNGTRAGALVGNRVTAHLVGAYGIFDWLEVGLQLPVVAFQRGDDLTNLGVSGVSTAGLGAPLLQGRVAFLRQDRKQPLDLGLTLGVTFPLGTAGALTRDPGLGLAFIPRLGAGYSFGPIRVGAELGATVRGQAVLSPTSASVSDEVGSQFTYGVVASTTRQLHFIRGELGLRGLVPFTRTGASAELLAGIRASFLEDDQLEIFAMGGPGFGRTPGTPAFRAMLGVTWAPSFAEKAAPKPVCVEGEPYTLSDCPGLDRDGDGVRNGADACPEKKGVSARKGCPDTDTDGDGVFDLVDACPKVAGESAFKGCPPPDSDGDGVLDANDACPKEKGLVERKGCPVRDGDGDGIEDEVDVCPAEKGIAELKGCPDRDGDGDEVVDRFDNCPTEKGEKDNQGCPKKVKQLVIITAEKLVILEKVFFATGKSTILPKSWPLLTQVASVLAAHPEIRKVRVEGHTDDKGKRELNLKLSQDRADAVKKFLTAKGVDGERLSAQGFGPDKPADTNATDKGRENNRRVEFVVDNG